MSPVHCLVPVVVCTWLNGLRDKTSKIQKEYSRINSCTASTAALSPCSSSERPTLIGAAVTWSLFWQYANHIFDTNSAKRFYPFLGMVGNVGLIIAGNVLVSFSDLSGISDANILWLDNHVE